MSPAEVRWRCERIAHLLTFCSRMESVMQVNAEAHNKPWLGDPRPAPLPLQMGGIHDGPIDANDYHASPIAPRPTPCKRKKKVVQ